MANETLQELNPNVIFYSDAFISTDGVGSTVDRLELIKQKMAAIGIGNSYTDAIPPGDMHHWQRVCDGIINSRLSATYKIPLVRITRAGRNLNQNNEAVPFFPDPIPDIASNLVAAKVVFAEYSDIDPNVNEVANVYYDNAIAQLDEIGGLDGMVGMNFLEGQEPKTRSQHAPPGSMPRNIIGR